METKPMGNPAIFQDSFGRVHDDLRISVTDRCNLRCVYCMPEDPIWFQRDEILSYEEILQIVRAATSRGVRKLRLTGGEPLVRKDLPSFIQMLTREPGIEDVSLTTNGLLLDRMAQELADAGLMRINVSLDTLDPERYAQMTRRDRLQRVFDGLDAAARAGLTPIKVNVVLLPGVNDDEIEPMTARAREQGWELRFIEFMPLENGETWDPSRVTTGKDVLTQIHKIWPIEPDPGADPHAPARRYPFKDGRGAVGFINSISEPFCADCSRLRLTSDGKFRVCLYDDAETDLKRPLRQGATRDELAEIMATAIQAKGPGGALEIAKNRKAPKLKRTMHQIGG